MKWTVLAASAAIAATLWLPGEAAQPTAQPAAPGAATAAASDPITFEQYRDWRLNFNARRQRELAAQLAASDLPAQQKARLEKIKAYYDWLAGLSEPDRDRRFRARFDRIDTDHDGQIDQSERAAWRDKQHAFYRNAAAAREQPAEAAAR